ncbi:MAG TPA: ABC transporter substrate-binding protein [Reyranella sp.]|nr:ABC transporter substrate-binding protein [Reyranella sp.]
MKRRALIAALAALPGALAPATRAQTNTTKVVGFLHSGAPTYLPGIMDRLRRSLAEHGFVDGKNLRIETRFAAGHYEQIPKLAKELLALKVDVVLAVGGSEPVNAFKAATSTVPIVFMSAIDPVRDGIVDSLSRPSGNITGVSLIGASLEPKRLEVLAQLVPGKGPLCALLNPRYPSVDQQRKTLRAAAAAVLDRPLEFVQATNAAEIAAAFKAAADLGSTGLTQAQDPFFASSIPQIVTAAAREKLPAVYQSREFVDLGGLASYGTNFIAAFGDAGGYLGRILNGAKPADLPVLQPTKFEFVVNLKAARAIGLELPTTVTSTADEVVE